MNSFIIVNTSRINQKLVNNKNMLEGIFDNKTAEKVLFHIFHYIEIAYEGIPLSERQKIFEYHTAPTE